MAHLVHLLHTRGSSLFIPGYLAVVLVVYLAFWHLHMWRNSTAKHAALSELRTTWARLHKWEYAFHQGQTAVANMYDCCSSPGNACAVHMCSGEWHTDMDGVGEGRASTQAKSPYFFKVRVFFTLGPPVVNPPTPVLPISTAGNSCRCGNWMCPTYVQTRYEQQEERGGKTAHFLPAVADCLGNIDDLLHIMSTSVN